ncbi:MAG: hypothetical protein PHG85_04500 [Candidatus Altiarchaeota archaeon]|nr:hypothetical protein [Candidatus Altiarchaeota archaeon]
MTAGDLHKPRGPDPGELRRRLQADTTNRLEEIQLRPAEARPQTRAVDKKQSKQIEKIWAQVINGTPTERKDAQKKLQSVRTNPETIQAFIDHSAGYRGYLGLKYSRLSTMLTTLVNNSTSVEIALNLEPYERRTNDCGPVPTLGAMPSKRVTITGRLGEPAVEPKGVETREAAESDEPERIFPAGRHPTALSMAQGANQTQLEKIIKAWKRIEKKSLRERFQGHEESLWADMRLELAGIHPNQATIQAFLNHDMRKHHRILGFTPPEPYADRPHGAVALITATVKDIIGFIPRKPYTPRPNGAFITALVNNSPDQDVELFISPYPRNKHPFYRLDYLGTHLNGKNLTLTGDTRSDFIGCKMESGTIIINGHAGYGAGSEMTGGRIIVEGTAGEHTDEHVVVQGNVSSRHGKGRERIEPEQRGARESY